MGAVAAALIAFAAVPGTARAEPSANLALAQGILASFGLESEIESIAQEAVAYLDAHREHIAPGHREPLRAIVRAGFRSETLYALTLDAFLDRYDPRHAAAAAAWLERPETRQLLEQGWALDRATSCLPRTPLHRWGRMRSAERYALVGRVGGDTSASARAVQRASLVFGGMLAAGNAMLPEAEQLTSPELEQLILAQRARLAAEYPTDARTFDCTYRGVDLETLREAARFLEGDAGRWMLDSIDAALGRALLLAAEAMAAHVVRTFSEGVRPSAALRSARALLPDASGAREPGAGASLEENAQLRHAPGAIPGRRP
jgi:hypothetical protein